ncbi:MAG: hypothetical protein IPM18_02400 [Phycisphaerales bacterium]|nr:hypothetical protein [Phycisphaerales bacterium]
MAILGGALLVFVLYLLWCLPGLPVGVRGLALLLGPWFGGLIAGTRGPRPVFQGAAACALAVLAWMAVGAWRAGPAESPCESGTWSELAAVTGEAAATVMLTLYAAGAGALAAWYQSRGGSANHPGAPGDHRETE